MLDLIKIGFMILFLYYCLCYVFPPEMSIFFCIVAIPSALICTYLEMEKEVTLTNLNEIDNIKPENQLSKFEKAVKSFDEKYKVKRNKKKKKSVNLINNF